jgi:hypothetical protein
MVTGSSARRLREQFAARAEGALSVLTVKSSAKAHRNTADLAGTVAAAQLRRCPDIIDRDYNIVNSVRAHTNTRAGSQGRSSVPAGQLR